MKDRLDAIIRLALKHNAQAITFKSVSSKQMEVYVVINDNMHRIKPQEEDYRLIKELLKMADDKFNIKKPHEETFYTNTKYSLDDKNYRFSLRLDNAKTYIQSATITLYSPVKETSEVPKVEVEIVDEPAKQEDVRDMVADELKSLVRDNKLLSIALTKACSKLASASFGIDTQSIRTMLLDESYREMNYE